MTTEDLATEFAVATEAAIDAHHVSLDGLAQAYADARHAREQVSDQEKRLREIEGRAELALFKSLEARNLRSIRHKVLGLFTINDMANAVVVDEIALREWANEVAPEVMLPNRARLGKMVRDALKEGDPLPPGTDVTFYQKINWRRGTGTSDASSE